MFNVGEKVIVIKGPMMGNEGIVSCVLKGRNAYGVKFPEYDNPSTKSGCYYLQEYELDKTGINLLRVPSLYQSPFVGFAGVNVGWCGVYIIPKIKKVIFNKPATIVFWSDDTKTVVKRQKGDRYNKEKGLAMAFVKKIYGNKGNYCNIFKEWINE